MSAADRTTFELRSVPLTEYRALHWTAGDVPGHCEQQQPTNAVARNSSWLRQIGVSRNTHA
jgi:hypothetical protein